VANVGNVFIEHLETFLNFFPRFYTFNVCFFFKFVSDRLLHLWILSGYQSSNAVGREMSSSLRATAWRPSVADWGGGMSASCTPRVQLSADAGNGWPHSALRYH